MAAIDRLEALGYLPLQELPGLQPCVSSHAMPPGSLFMAKGMEAVIEYGMQDGSSFENRVCLASFFLVSSDGHLLDCFCLPQRRFEIKALEDWNALSRLHDEYRRDLEEAVEADRSDPRAGGANPCSA